MENIVLVAVIAVIIVSALVYVIKAKKKGVKCIGCPSGGKCNGSCSECTVYRNNDE